jgi:hypothetical protein
MTSMLRVNREIRSSKIAASRAASSSIGASLSEHVNGLAQGHEPDGDDTQRCQVGQACLGGPPSPAEDDLSYSLSAHCVNADSGGLASRRGLAEPLAGNAGEQLVNDAVEGRECLCDGL